MFITNEIVKYGGEKMAVKRTKRKPKEMREMLEDTDMKFIMLNNRLFDDFYTKGKVEYRPLLNKKGDTYTDHKGNEYPYSEFSDVSKKITVTFDERDFILVILIKFLSQLKFKGYSIELANFINEKWSDKRIKERLKKLQFLEGVMNNIYEQKNKKRTYYQNGVKVRLINEEKVQGYENGNKRTFYQWHLNFDCDYKKELDKEKNEIEKPINFFKVTIYDLDLLTSGLLNEKEFITYLYFIRSYNPDKEIWHSMEAISEKMNIKDSRITEKIMERLVEIRVKDKFNDEENQTWPLLHVKRPDNYEKKVRNREQPSSYYIPIYNISTNLRLNGDDPNPYNKNEDQEWDDTLDELLA